MDNKRLEAIRQFCAQKSAGQRLDALGTDREVVEILADCVAHILALNATNESLVTTLKKIYTRIPSNDFDGWLFARELARAAVECYETP